MFQSVLNLILVTLFNPISQKTADISLWLFIRCPRQLPPNSRCRYFGSRDTASA